MEEFQPGDVYIIDDLETLRCIAEPLRMQIYEMLVVEPASVRQVAERLGLSPSRLYYHFNTLEKIELIRVVETRMVSNLVEKYYRAVAYQLDVNSRLLTFESDEGKAAITEMITSGLDATREDLLRSLHARTFELERGAPKKPRQMIVNRTTARIRDELAEEFGRRLKELMAEFEESDQKGRVNSEDMHVYAFYTAFYPSFYFSENQEGDPSPG